MAVSASILRETIYNISAAPESARAGTDVHKLARQIEAAIAPLLRGRYHTVQAQDVFGQAKSIHIRSGNITPEMIGHNVAWHNDLFKFQAIVSGFNKDGSAKAKIVVEQLSGHYAKKKMRKKSVKPGKEHLLVNHIKKYVAGLMKDAPAPRAEGTEDDDVRAAHALPHFTEMLGYVDDRELVEAKAVIAQSWVFKKKGSAAKFKDLISSMTDDSWSARLNKAGLKVAVEHQGPMPQSLYNRLDKLAAAHHGRRDRTVYEGEAGPTDEPKDIDNPWALGEALTEGKLSAVLLTPDGRRYPCNVRREMAVALAAHDVSDRSTVKPDGLTYLAEAETGAEQCERFLDLFGGHKSAPPALDLWCEAGVGSAGDDVVHRSVAKIENGGDCLGASTFRVLREDHAHGVGGDGAVRRPLAESVEGVLYVFGPADVLQVREPVVRSIPVDVVDFRSVAGRLAEERQRNKPMRRMLPTYPGQPQLDLGVPACADALHEQSQRSEMASYTGGARSYQAGVADLVVCLVPDNGKPSHGEPFSESMVEVYPLGEVAPPGFSGTAKAMKKHFDDPRSVYRLAWHMYGKGAKPHYKPEKGKPRYKSPEKYAADKAKAESEEANRMAESRFYAILSCRLTQTQQANPHTF